MTFRLLFCMGCMLALAACQSGGGKYSALRSLSDQERTLYERAAEARTVGNIDEALEIYRQAAKISKSAVEAHVAIAEILRSQNKAAQSIPMLQDALLLQPGDPRLHTEMGFALIATQSFPEALGQFDHAIALDADYGMAYSGKGVTLDLQGKHKEAQAVYQQAVKRKLATPALENNYGLSLIFSGDYQRAVDYLQPLVDSPNATKTMRQNLALAYGLLGDVGKSRQYGMQDLNPKEVAENLKFYKRYTAMQQKPAVEYVHQAVPVAPVEEGDVGYMTGEAEGAGIQKPRVEVIEVGEDTFEDMLEPAAGSPVTGGED